MRKLVIWHNLNKDTYYYKFVTGCYDEYFPGKKNQYNHQVILVIESNYLTPIYYKVSLFKTLLTPIIYLLSMLLKFLENINRKL